MYTIFGHFDPENNCLDSKNKWFSRWPNRYSCYNGSTDNHASPATVYRITSKYSNALRTSQTRSFASWYHILHPKVAFEAPWSCARCGIKYFHDIILHPSLNQCWKTLLFEYLAAIQYADSDSDRVHSVLDSWNSCVAPASTTANQKINNCLDSEI